MNDYLIYLCLPPYLAQWYAHECNQVHNRDKATCPREIYRFPTPVVPVRGSQESVLTTVLCCTGCTYTLRASGFERVRKSRIVTQYRSPSNP